MDAAKRARLESAGFTVGNTTEFLGLTAEENAYIEMRLALSAGLKRRRTEKQLSQTALAEQIGSSQSRVAKMEAGDPNVSIDLLVCALFAVGATRQEVGELIGAAK